MPILSLYVQIPVDSADRDALDARVRSLLSDVRELSQDKAMDHDARMSLRGDLERMLVAPGVDEQLVGVDGPRDLLARLAADARDVAGGRAVGDGLELRPCPPIRPRAARSLRQVTPPKAPIVACFQWKSRERLTACGKAAGVTVEHRSVPGASLVPKVLQQASSRTLPDLLMMDNPDLQQIAQTGALTPLNQYGVDSSGFANGILSAGTYKGKVYGLAPYVSTVALFYNKDMLAKAGVAVPRTWDELKTAAAKLTRLSPSCIRRARTRSPIVCS